MCEARQDHGVEWFEQSDVNAEAPLTLILMTYGKCVYWLDGSKAVLEKGDMLLIPKIVPFYGKSIPTVLHSKFVVRFNITADGPRLPLLQKEDPTRRRLGKYEIVHDRLKMMESQWSEGMPYFREMGAALLLEVLVHWSRELDREPWTPDKLNYAELMKEYIQNHYRSKITKEDLGRHIEKSPNYAASLFSGITGQTISDYVHAVRTKTAIYMLRHSQLTVGEIAEFLGYSDASWFHKVFKRSTGRSPSEYMLERPARVT